MCGNVSDELKMFEVKDKVIAITGAGGVLCGTMAKHLAKAGAKIAVLDLNEEAAKKIADEIKAENGIVLAVKCNVLEKSFHQNPISRKKDATESTTVRA